MQDRRDAAAHGHRQGAAGAARLPFRRAGCIGRRRVVVRDYSLHSARGEDLPAPSRRSLPSAHHLCCCPASVCAPCRFLHGRRRWLLRPLRPRRRAAARPPARPPLRLRQPQRRLSRLWIRRHRCLSSLRPRPSPHRRTSKCIRAHCVRILCAPTTPFFSFCCSQAHRLLHAQSLATSGRRRDLPRRASHCQTAVRERQRPVPVCGRSTL